MLQFAICLIFFHTFDVEAIQIHVSGPVCPDVDGPSPAYITYPGDCSKFWQCSDGKPYLHDCPHGLHFNSISNVCDWPEKPGCAAEESDTEENAGNNTCLQHGLECPRVDGKYPVFGALPDCTKFCQCSNGKPYEHNCPHGLHFNSVLNMCDWPEKAGCAAEKIDLQEEAGIDTCLQHGIECHRVDGRYPVYGALPDCTKFCQCSNGKPYLHDCPQGLHFNSVLNVCDWPKKAGCTAV